MKLIESQLVCVDLNEPFKEENDAYNARYVRFMKLLESQLVGEDLNEAIHWKCEEENDAYNARYVFFMKLVEKNIHHLIGARQHQLHTDAINTTDLYEDFSPDANSTLAHKPQNEEKNKTH